MDKYQLPALGARSLSFCLISTIITLNRTQMDGWFPLKEVHAGLVGHLSLLLALPVFSAPITALTVVLRQCLMLGVWRAHPFLPPAGHERFRGTVVTVYLDPTNPEWSTEEILGRLQNGEFGPFYGP